jgi:hypothetical protein
LNDKPATPAATVVYAPPSLSIHVRCSEEKPEKPHSMTGLFVILRMAVAGPSHPSIDKVVAVHDAPATPATPDAPAQDPDAAALATRFVCTIVDVNGYLQPVHDSSNPWCEIFAPEPPPAPAKKGVPPKTREMARIPVDTDGQFVGCLLRNPQPSMARALTKWLNGEKDKEGHGFDQWEKPRTALLAGEKALGGNELLARVLTISKDTSNGTQLVLTVSENAADFLPPKFEAHGGWLLYYDMPHGRCPPVVTQVKALQRRLGVLRFPVGGEENPYAPEPIAVKYGKETGNDGKFDTRTLSAVRAFQLQAAEGKATKPLAWPPGHTDSADGRHDWWFVVGTDVVDADKLTGVLPGCADEKTWAKIDAWITRKVRKQGVILVKNPSSYMRYDAALSVLAWRRLAAIFGVHYTQTDPNLAAETELASQYSLADFNAGLDLEIAHPHKTGHAIDFGVVDDQVGPIMDYARPRSNWPIHYEGQWWVWHRGDIDKTPEARAKLAAAKKNQDAAKAAVAQATTAEATAKTALDAANALDPPNPAKQKSATSAHDRASDALTKAQKKDVDAGAAVDKAKRDLDDAEAKFKAAKDDAEHRGWAIHFRLYGHSHLDVFGNADAALDELYRSVDGLTSAFKTSMSHDFGDTPATERDTFLGAQLTFLSTWESKLKESLGPPDARNAAGRAEIVATVFRATVKQWMYNPYSRAAGKPGPDIRPDADTGAVGYLDEERNAGTPNVPPGSKSFVNLTYIGWICRMFRISGRSSDTRDPRGEGQKAPRQRLSAVKTFFGRIVGLLDRMNRDGSNEKDEPIVSMTLTRHLPDLDLEFMKRWARALPAMRPKVAKGVAIMVTTSDPQVTIELVATKPVDTQLQAVWDKLDESGSSRFVLVAAGKSALLDPALIAESGKPGIVAADVGRIDTGAAWRARLENVATIFQTKIATANVTPAAKAAVPPGKKPPQERNVKRDPSEWQITLQPVFENTAPTSLVDVAFQPLHPCELPTPGHGVQLEWWHHQHEDSVDKPYTDMLTQIGYASEILFRPRQAPATDQPDTYSGRGAGANPSQEHRFSLQGGSPKAPENGDTDSGMYW